MAHQAAAEEHEILADLVPRRPASAEVCADCDGTGSAVVRLAREGVVTNEEAERLQGRTLLCGTCYGLGWLDPSEPSRP